LEHGWGTEMQQRKLENLAYETSLTLCHLAAIRDIRAQRGGASEATYAKFGIAWNFWTSNR